MDGALTELGRALAEGRANAYSLAAEAGWPPDPTGFRALYDDVMDEVSRSAEGRGIGVREVERAYGVLVDGDRHLTSHEELVERTGMDFHTARQAAAVLSGVGDFHECYDDDWKLYWVRCDEFIKEKCDERRISLHRYFDMRDELHEFQNKTISWYVRRNRRQSQPYSLTELKEEFVHRLQERYFPEKPVGDEWSRHIAARYLRTAQDSIARSFNLSY